MASIWRTAASACATCARCASIRSRRGPARTSANCSCAALGLVLCNVVRKPRLVVCLRTCGSAVAKGERSIEIAFRVIHPLRGRVAVRPRLSDFLIAGTPLHLREERAGRIELRLGLIEPRLLLRTIQSRQDRVGLHPVSFPDGDIGDPAGQLEAELRLCRLRRARGKELVAGASIARLMGDDDDGADREDPDDGNEPSIGFHGLDSKFWASHSRESWPVMRARSTRVTISR